jgi:DNA-damage-inducible protein J
MSQANINIRMDEDLKQKFDAMCKELGLNMTTAVTIFARQVVREQAIPFRIGYTPNAETIAAIEEVQEMKRNPHLYKGYNSVAELFADLDNDE